MILQVNKSIAEYIACITQTLLINHHNELAKTSEYSVCVHV